MSRESEEFEFARRVAFDRVHQERVRQDAKWGGPSHDDEHQPVHWVRFIGLRAGRLFNVEGRLNYRKLLTEIAALALAALESDIRKNGL